MIKRLATAALAVMSLTATSLSASAAWEVWQGSLFFTTVSRACPASTARVGGFLNAVLRPNGLQGNGSNTLLALFSLANAQSYGFVGALAGNGTYTNAERFTATAGRQIYNGTYSRARIKPTPAVGKPFLNVRVKLTNFNDQANCTVTLEGTLGLNPNF